MVSPWEAVRTGHTEIDPRPVRQKGRDPQGDNRDSVDRTLADALQYPTPLRWHTLRKQTAAGLGSAPANQTVLRRRKHPADGRPVPDPTGYLSFKSHFGCIYILPGRGRN